MNKMDILLKTRKLLLKNKINFNQPIILAVSGGADSVCLLDVFSKIFDKKYITVAHFDHGLKNDSREDAQFVEKLCKKYQIEFISAKANNLKKQSGNLEENARETRYNFLLKTAFNNQANLIFTAHHGDDQLETILMNFKRGASYEGLTGMDFLSKKYFSSQEFIIARPFLNFFKNNILSYLKDNNLLWREDYTNYNLKFKRNFFRHLILTNIEIEQKKDVLRQVNQLRKNKIDFYKKLEKLIGKYLKKESKNIIIFNPSVLSLKKDILSEIIFYSARKILGSSKDLNKKNLEKIISELKNKKFGKEYLLPNKLKLILDYDALILLKGSLLYNGVATNFLKLGNNKVDIFNINLKKTNRFLSKGYNLSFTDLSWPLKIRSYLPGDKFKPKRATGSKKIKNYFIDKKIPRTLRKSIPLIVNSKNVILVILGIKESSLVLEKSIKKDTILNITFKEISK